MGFEDVYGSRSRTWIYADINLDPTNPLEWGGIYRAGLSPVLCQRDRDLVFLSSNALLV